MSSLRLPALLLSSLLAASVLSACDPGDDPGPDGGSQADPGIDAGVQVDAGTDAGIDAGMDPDAGTGADAGIIPVYGDAIDAGSETWTYVEFPEARCGNGTATGIAVNLTDRSPDVLIFLQGGGACWDYSTCFGIPGFIPPLASHIEETMDEGPVLAEAQAVPFAFDRNQLANPFRDASFVYVPYCTGDIYGGDAVQTYTSGQTSKTVHHRGRANLEAFLSRLVPTFPGAQRVWLAGVSAGGYGATVNWELARAYFDGVRVDVLNDSGAPVDFDPSRFRAMKASWNLSIPADCPDCEDSIAALLPHYATRITSPSRYGFLSFREDTVISGSSFPFGFSGQDFATFGQGLDALRAAAGENQKTFYVEGRGHVLLSVNPSPQTADELTAIGWINQLVTDDAAWDHAGP
jgi:hypothetical protein